MGSAQKALMEQAQQLRDKDQQIAGLMEEGQKLSIIELKSSQMIKKQRAKDAEQEKTIKDLEKRLSESQLDASQLKERVARMAENEKKFNDSVKAVNDTNERQTKELIRLEQELSKTQSALETALQELSHARRQNAEATAAAQSDALDVEVKAKEVALRTLEAVQVDAQAAQASAKKEVGMEVLFRRGKREVLTVASGHWGCSVSSPLFRQLAGSLLIVSCYFR
ncbi:MAG: hypothetical protein BJ554DRAFT_3519 [Olpidium bornovanus]|uniref:Uncharacterized protein n=1 Tax=Olpidium bornovanus TaxID=278681 RepID=A0A8H7ZNM5_9FUNG|nr:MAG: hypothetical protein BJ554DRAFT_3519 [Olpidium bornovanus]